MDGCGLISNIIYISVFKEMSLSLIEKECLYYHVEYDSYDKWLIESFQPSFVPDGLNEKYYSIFDENPGNELGELHLHIGCQSNFTWYIQIGIENEWIKWETGGFHALPNSDRFFTGKINEKTGREFIEELRRYLIRVADIDKLVPKDERIPIITNISIKIVDENGYINNTLKHSDTYILTCIRLVDSETIKPILIKPKHGDIVPTGFLLTYMIKEDAYHDTLQLIIKPRESDKYKTDNAESRMITLEMIHGLVNQIRNIQQNFVQSWKDVLIQK